MSEIENGMLGLYGSEHSICNHLMTLGFKGLNPSRLLTHPLLIIFTVNYKPLDETVVPSSCDSTYSRRRCRTATDRPIHHRVSRSDTELSYTVNNSSISTDRLAMSFWLATALLDFRRRRR